MLNLKKTAPQYICVLIYTSGQQITVSKEIFCVLQAEWEYCGFCHEAV